MENNEQPTEQQRRLDEVLDNPLKRFAYTWKRKRELGRLERTMDDMEISTPGRVYRKAERVATGLDRVSASGHRDGDVWQTPSGRWAGMYQGEVRYFSPASPRETPGREAAEAWARSGGLARRDAGSFKPQREEVELDEASAYAFKVVKRPPGMPKNHTLIKYKNQYFCFTAEPKSQGQGGTNPDWTKAAIWKCDRNGKRTSPLEDPVWDSKRDGWSAEDAFDDYLDYTGGELDEAARGRGLRTFREIVGLNTSAETVAEGATPGKPETMAQKHARMQGYTGNPDDQDQGQAYRSQKQFLAFVREVAKDWHSGDMALSRMQSLVTSELGWLVRGSSYPDPADPDVIRMKALSGAFRKRVKSAGLEPTSRLGDGGGFRGSAMGKITPNQIGRYFDLVVDFVQNDWPGIEAGIKGKNP